jgi:hypothetical protein
MSPRERISHRGSQTAAEPIAVKEYYEDVLLY